VVVLSIHEAGGLLALKKAAAIAEAAGVGLCLHGQSISSITDLAQHHVGLTIPNLTDGNQIMHQLLVEDLVSAPDLTPQQGKLGVYDKPGIGLTINWDAIGRAAEFYRKNERYHDA
jgi:L-alanine-DL-glutamate epimerase-like enolase superfamily enzyme